MTATECIGCLILCKPEGASSMRAGSLNDALRNTGRSRSTVYKTSSSYFNTKATHYS